MTDAVLLSALITVPALVPIEGAADLQIVGTIRASRDIYYGGDGIITNIVDVKGGRPVSCRVRLFRDRDAVCLAEAVSGVDGVYTFSDIDRAERYTCIALDHTGNNRDAIANGLIPERMP